VEWLFVAAAPGLKELMTIGKIWYEQDRKEADGRFVWDLVVVDAGASGHSLQYLQMPGTAAQAFSSGLVHREATRVESLLKDPARSCIHVVALNTNASGNAPSSSSTIPASTTGR